MGGAWREACKNGAAHSRVIEDGANQTIHRPVIDATVSLVERGWGEGN